MCRMTLVALIVVIVLTPLTGVPISHVVLEPRTTHILVDITCPSVVSAATLPIASTDPRAVSLAHEANKRRTYGVVAPHVVLPFVLDDSGGLGKEAWTCLLQCRNRAGSQLAPRGGRIKIYPKTKPRIDEVIMG